MAATFAGISFSTPRIVSVRAELPKPQLSQVRLFSFGSRRVSPKVLRFVVASSSSTPQNISEKVAQSIKKAEEVCAGDAVSGECVAAWDEVEELSAAASHARDKLKEDSDPLEKYCKENPETNECRTYDN